MVNHSKPILITTENHHAGETLTLAPYFFPSPQCPRSFSILVSPLLGSKANNSSYTNHWTN